MFPCSSLFNTVVNLDIVVSFLLILFHASRGLRNRPRSQEQWVCRSDYGQRTDGHGPTVTDLPSFNHDGYSGDLLKINLEIHRGNADALLDISVLKLQKLGTEQKAEIQKLQAEKTSNLIITPSTSESRRKTDEPHSSGATTMSVDNDETVVVYSASDNELTVRQRRSMKGTVLNSIYLVSRLRVL